MLLKLLKKLKQVKLNTVLTKLGTFMLQLVKFPLMLNTYTKMLWKLLIQLFLLAIPTVKGLFVKNLTVASTMGPGIKVAFESFV